MCQVPPLPSAWPARRLRADVSRLHSACCAAGLVSGPRHDTRPLGSRHPAPTVLPHSARPSTFEGFVLAPNALCGKHANCSHRNHGPQSQGGQRPEKAQAPGVGEEPLPRLSLPLSLCIQPPSPHPPTPPPQGCWWQLPTGLPLSPSALSCRRPAAQGTRHTHCRSRPPPQGAHKSPVSQDKSLKVRVLPMTTSPAPCAPGPPLPPSFLPSDTPALTPNRALHLLALGPDPSSSLPGPCAPLLHVLSPEA